jgi:parallel beta-helix repeat protein
MKTLILWPGLRDLLVLSAAGAVACSAWADGPNLPRSASIQVGVDQGDFRGNDHRVLQAAIDYVASLGGGTVSIGPGHYQMRNALTLRSGVNISGVPSQTVLEACDGLESRLVMDGDCNERQITLANPAGFRIGDGVSIQDERKGGFEVTTATLTEQLSPNTFRISAPLYLDYMVSDKASARLAFPVVGGWNVTNVSVAGLVIEGNRDHAQPLNGCRGGGIYLFECADVTIRDCTVRRYNGDGISFQVSQRVIVEDCLSEANAGLGLHPGSGSQHPIVRRNRSIGNGSDGLYVCWRVKYGRFEENQIKDNKGAGISIGHKDSDNVFRDNSITANRGAGILFRPETEAMGAHRNVFELNVILDNGLAADGKATSDPVVIRGVHRDLQFRKNTIGYSQPLSIPVAAIDARDGAHGLRLDGNQFENAQPEVTGAK